ncbi:MAG: aspartyl/glutamyl-tRNA amidotransferase subunit C [Deltaproteobacteria bacterium]|nr:aspartyl/glutamyl-tRNA amidotransferase subunit C [Deltaproteobacteria bacterium]
MTDCDMDIKDIEKIAGLANLDLTGEEKQSFVGHFNTILDYFKILESAPSQDHLQTLHTTDSRLREDVATPSGINPESFSPYLENRHFKVPRVIE